MHLIPNDANFNFMGFRRYTFVLSAVLLAIAIGSLVTRGLNFGIDFTGGVLIEVTYPHSADLAQVRSALGGGGFKDAEVQYFGTSQDVMIRLGPRKGKNASEVSNAVLSTLQAKTPGVKLSQVEFVGPQVGSALTEKGSLAVLYALIGILIYVAVRFEWRFASGSVIALFHDVIITLGVFSLFQIPFDLTVLAAILAIIGYSINDSIVVGDRIRENFRRMRKGSALGIMNSSINQTLSRTVITSLTVLLVVVVLYFLGGSSISGFALCMIIGTVFGTYSSIFVASALALEMGLSREKLVAPPKPKEGDDML